MPGREVRFNEKPYESLNLLVSSFLPEFLLITSGKNYSVFGHSMGAQIAYELTKVLESRRLNLPSQLLLSGRRPPHLTKEDPNYHTLSDEDLIQKLIELGGISTEALEYPELIRFFLPTIRADFKLIETIGKYETRPLNLPICVFSGTNDHRAPPQEMGGWRFYTNSDFKEYTLDGGHFFLNSAQNKLFRIVEKCILFHT
jgi:surfactin synthase thioesterase subunit